MTRQLLPILFASAVLSNVAQANDIVDFLRAISGPSYSAHDHVHQRHAQRPVTPHAGHAHGFHADRVPVIGGRHTHELHRSRSIRSSRPSFSVSFNLGRPSPQVVQAPVLPPPPEPGSFVHLPHQIGDVVTCPVPITTCVRVRNTHNISPCAVPSVLAVRDPNIGRFRTCTERLAYVQVFIPQCPLRCMRLSPCKTRLRLDYGKYEIDIVSRNGQVNITYRD